MKLSIITAFAISALFVTGCKSEYQAYADESCACKDSACIKDVGEKHKNLLGGEKATLKEMDAKLAALPEKDQKEFKRGFECMMKVAMADVEKEKK